MSVTADHFRFLVLMQELLALVGDRLEARSVVLGAAVCPYELVEWVVGPFSGPQV